LDCQPRCPATCRPATCSAGQRCAGACFTHVNPPCSSALCGCATNATPRGADTKGRGPADKGAGGASAYVRGGRCHAPRLPAGVRERGVRPRHGGDLLGWASAAPTPCMQSSRSSVDVYTEVCCGSGWRQPCGVPDLPIMQPCSLPRRCWLSRLCGLRSVHRAGPLTARRGLPRRFLQMTGYSAEEVLGHNWCAAHCLLRGSCAVGPSRPSALRVARPTVCSCAPGAVSAVRA